MRCEIGWRICGIGTDPGSEPVDLLVVEEVAEPGPPGASPHDDHVRSLARTEAVDRHHSTVDAIGRGPKALDVTVVVDVGMLRLRAAAAPATHEHRRGDALSPTCHQKSIPFFARMPD